MRLKRRPVPNPADHRGDLDLPAIAEVTRSLLGTDTAVRPIWHYETGALECVEVRTRRAIAHIPGVLSQLTSRITSRLGEQWICDRHPQDPDAIRIAKAAHGLLTQAGLDAIVTTLTVGAASLGCPRVLPSYSPGGDLEAIEIRFSSGRKVGDQVISDFTARTMPGDWIPSWTDPDTLRLTPEA